jgi:transposase-like protein
MFDLQCPYCEAEIDVNRNDGFGCSDGCKDQMECETCNKIFIFYTSISFNYAPFKADCLNGGDHIWKISETIPEKFAYEKCMTCGEPKE